MVDIFSRRCYHVCVTDNSCGCSDIMTVFLLPPHVAVAGVAASVCFGVFSSLCHFLWSERPDGRTDELTDKAPMMPCSSGGCQSSPSPLRSSLAAAPSCSWMPDRHFWLCVWGNFLSACVTINAHRDAASCLKLQKCAARGTRSRSPSSNVFKVGIPTLHLLVLVLHSSSRSDLKYFLPYCRLKSSVVHVSASHIQLVQFYNTRLGFIMFLLLRSFW